MKLLRKGTALLLSVAMVVGLVAGGLLIHTVADTAIQWYDADLDDLSRFYETGNARSPGMISTVDGDAGGKSYGMYMFASNAGTPHAFAEWCKRYPEGSTYHDIGATLDEAYHYISDGYGAFFDAAWEGIAYIYGSTFASAQYDYTKATIYDEAVSKVESTVAGFDIDNYSVALKNVFWSRAVQHGASGACSLIVKAFNTLGGFANQPEAQLIQAIYAESGRLVTAAQLSSETSGRSGPAMSGDTANKYGTSGLTLRYFFGCSGDVQMGVYRRLAVNEPSDALVMLMNNGYSGAIRADGCYRLLYNKDQRLALDAANGVASLNAASAEGASQVFTMNYYAGGFYTFNIKVGDRTLRLSAEGGAVTVSALSASSSQLWELVQGGSGYLLKNKGTGTYLSAQDGKLVMTAESPVAWELSSAASTAAEWITSGLIYPTASTVLVAGRSSFPVRGVVSCSAAITSLNISILSGGSAVINKTVAPNGTAYDLKRLDDSIAYSALTQGSYTFVLTATANGQNVELVRSDFTVKPNDGSTVSDESFLITFDAQGGTINGSSTKRVTLDDTVYGELPTATRRDAQFLGWFTEGGEQIVASTPVRAANLTLYARYAGMHTYTFLDASGGRYYSSTAAAGELIIAPAVSPAKAPDSQYAYTFKGWEGYTFGVTVMGDSDMTFKPVYEAVKLSDITAPEGAYWPGLTPGTTVAQLGGAAVYSGTTQVTEGLLATGMTATTGGKTYTLVVTGDANGDGKVTITDVVTLQSHVVGKQTLEGAYAKAGDLNGDGKVTITDVVKAARVVVGKDTIS